MKIAVDRNSLSAVKPGNEYIYLFDKEPLQDLLNKNIHCLNYKYCNFVEINLTDFDINCIKKAKLTDKNYDKLPEKINYKYAVIVPNYNNDHGKYNDKSFLRNCIESVLNQTYKDFQLIIVDDMSTDTSVETIKSYKDERVHLIENKRKRYNGGSRNVGIEYAFDNLNFDYFCFLDSDDWWKHERVLETINSRLYGHEMLTLGSEMLGKNGFVGYQTFNRAETYEDLYCMNNNLWCTAWCRVIRKDKIVYFCEDTLMEDRVWTYKLADNLSFDKVINLKEICYCWNRTNTENSVSQLRNNFWNASAWCHIGHQLQMIDQLKHKEIIPILEKRIKTCIAKINNGIYEQY